jgi:hypothetical protein
MSVVCASKYRNENIFYHLVIALVSLIISFFFTLFQTSSIQILYFLQVMQIYTENVCIVLEGTINGLCFDRFQNMVKVLCKITRWNYNVADSV